MNVLVFGNSGSGKSTFAGALARVHGLAHLDLDTIVWEADTVAVERRPADVRASLETFLASYPRWVIEGCYGELVEVAAGRCTELVFLNPGLSACLDNNRRRPWEPHKYATKEAQDAMLADLQEWVTGYYQRQDAWSYTDHRRLFEAFTGPKREITSTKAADELRQADPVQEQPGGLPMNRTAYNSIATQWDTARSGFYGRERDYIEAVLSAAPPGSTLLDLGCGTGRPMAEHIVSRGRRVLGVDQSEAMLAIARRRLPREQWRLSAMETYRPAAGFQGALIWDALFHLPRTLHEPILHRVVDALPSGGRLMLSVGGSAQPPFTDVMFGQEFSYDSHTPQQTELILRGLGCRIILAEVMNKPDGKRDKGRDAIIAEKA
ncbi:methyltransferase domain-containing protein [Synechococcus sp. CCY 9618]|uniref:methyltransferase domain-containing protein n=1 Tax=Synechococcus sp. CCY 9618 TaxID=2815602 RepID=UPI001C23E5C0|nr:methyltransferase domain-containing protein [Synechococcus sp. CCY 9618]